jgi:hypothetical protein
MRGDLLTARAPASEPALGRWVPTALVPLTFLAVAVGLCLLAFASPFWRGIGVLLSVASTLVPQVVSRWWLLLLLGMSQYFRAPSATDGVFYLLLAGVHLLQLLAGLAGMLPWHGRLQLSACVRPLQRYLLVQVVVQPVAAATLLAFGGGLGTVPGLSILTAALVAAVAAVFARGLRRGWARG